MRGPFFDELQRGQIFDHAPDVTLTSGLAVAHQAIVGDRLRLPLSDTLPGLESTGGNPLELSDPLSSSLLGPALTPMPSVKPKDREPGEVQYPLWALLAVGVVLGLVVVGVGLLLYFAFR